MKRSHSPDTYDHQQNSNFRGGHQFRGGYHGHHPFNKRHRGDGSYNQPHTVEEKIIRLGDTGSSNKDISSLAKDIDIELDNKVGGDEEKIKTITAIICKCVISFPTRLATYSTLIGLISVKHYNISCQIINTLHASYPVYLEAQKWQEALTIIHLLSHLVNCKVIRPSALISQFELLLEITLEDSVPQARSDYYVYTVLSSLPIVAFELAAQPEPNTFDQLLNTIETYLTKRSKDHLNVTRVWLSSDSTVQMDYLDSLWVQTKNFKANNWTEVFIHRPYYEKECKDTMASSLIPQNSPTIQIPAHSPDYIYPPPRIVFRLFEDDVAEGHKSIPGSDKIERFCIESHIRNIIDEISTDPRDCARHLSHLYRSDQLPIKHILIETILGELFSLPAPRHDEILYHTLLLEFTKIFHPSKNSEELKYNYDSVLNEAVRTLYENLETMSVTCFDRFVNWFSFHLNNIEFFFPWQIWTDATFKEIDSPKYVFVREILYRCIRLCFYKKIARVVKMSSLVNNNLATLMPPEAKISYQPIFSDTPKAGELSVTIKKLISEKADVKRISETLNIQIDGVELPENPVADEEKHFDKLVKIDIFTAVVLHMAEKSLTHLSSAIGKFRHVFKALTRVEGGQVQLLQTMHSCLETHPQLQVILVDKLLKAELVEAKEVCCWIFSEPMKPLHLNSYLWELLNNTLSRTSRAVRKMIKSKKEVENQVSTIKKEKLDDDEDKGEEDVEMVQEDKKRELEEKIETAEVEFRELIYQVFDMFSETLADHITKCMESNKSYMDNWFRWIVGRMQQVYYNHYCVLQPHFEKIKVIVDKTPSVGNSIYNLSQ